jgi:hypothetical protein
MAANPLDDLARYCRLTEWSLLVDVSRWQDDADAGRRGLGQAWDAILNRRVPWKMACERLVRFDPGQSELASIFTDADFVEKRVRAQLPAALAGWPFRADVARHSHRPLFTEAARQNFIYEPATDQVCLLSEHDRFARLPVSFALCRLYVRDRAHDTELALALDRLLKAEVDERSNM